MSCFDRNQQSSSDFDKMKSQSFDAESGERAHLLESPEKKTGCFARHPQVYYCEKVPAQYVDFVTGLGAGAPLVFGIIWGASDCPGSPTLPAYLQTTSVCFLLINIYYFCFRIPKYKFSEVDNSLVCTKVGGLLSFLNGFWSIWGSICVFPNIGNMYFHHSADPSSTSSTTGTGSTTGTPQLAKDDGEWKCKGMLFTPSLIVTIILLLILVIGFVIMGVIVLRLCTEEKMGSGDNRSSEKCGETRVQVQSPPETVVSGTPVQSPETVAVDRNNHQLL